MTELRMDREEFHIVFGKLEDEVPYELGAKPEWGADTSEVKTSDCSGFVRYMLSRCVADMPTNYPEGSVVQHAWAASKLQAFDIQSAAYDEDSNIVYVFYLAPGDGKDVHGHTGFLFQGAAYHCYGGHGVGKTSAQEVIDWGAKYAYVFPSFVP